MRHKYLTPALVLARTPLAEASSLVTVVTPEFGIIRGRAQGLRKPGAKMSAGLQTFCEADVSMVRGKEGWRMTGAILAKNWANVLPKEACVRAGRVVELALRLTHGESMDTGAALFKIFTGYLAVLADAARTDDEHDAAELLAVLRVLRSLGLVADPIPGDDGQFDTETLALVHADRKSFITRINSGIEASGL